MSRPEFSSVFADRLSSFVAIRRLGGYDFRTATKHLLYFDRFLAKGGFADCRITREIIQGYLNASEHLHPSTRRNRMSTVRQFCRYLRQFEPSSYLPEYNMLPKERRSSVSYIYTEEEVSAMLAAALRLPPSDSLRAQTYHTFFGLLYTTGLRCGEALALNLTDVHIKQQMVYVCKGKFGKSRWIPLSSSMCSVLHRYIEARTRFITATPEDPLFISLAKNRLSYPVTYEVFRRILCQCGLREQKKGSPGPRIHDLRHTFACRRLLLWYRQGRNVNALLPALSTYLGHVGIASTQRYLRATAELLGEANERFLRNFRRNVLKKGDHREQ